MKMKKIIKKVPLSLSGVMLGFAALGNLLQSYGEEIRYTCGLAAFIFTSFTSIETGYVSQSN